MKKILVTGATGFIGGYVIEALLHRGFRVIATSSDHAKAVSKKWYPNVDYVEMDLKRFDSSQNYFSLFHEPDLMIHLAWEGLPNYLQPFHITSNLPRHQAFLHNMISNGLSDLTVSGTCLEYGMVEGCMHEDMVPHPENSYAQSKNLLREYLEKVKLSAPFSFKWVRLFYMYGDGQHPNSLIPQLERALNENLSSFNMSGGMQIRDFLHIKVVARYLVDIATQQKVDGIVNCCSGNPISIKEFVMNYLASKSRFIKLNLGYYPYTTFEPMSFWGDTSKLKTIVNL